MPGSLQKSHKVSESRERHAFCTFMAFVSTFWLESHFRKRYSWNRSPSTLGAHWSGDFQRAFRSGPYYRVQLPYKEQSHLTQSLPPKCYIREKESCNQSSLYFHKLLTFFCQWAWPLESRSMLYGRSTSAAEIRDPLLVWMAENQIGRGRKHAYDSQISVLVMWNLFKYQLPLPLGEVWAKILRWRHGEEWLV